MLRIDEALVTIPHTGTIFFRERNGIQNLFHTTPDSIRNIRAVQKMWTTVRDPYRILASWRNRAVGPRWQEILWCDLCIWSKEVMARAPEILCVDDFPGEEPKNSVADINNLHAALDANDWAHYFSVVPRSYVELIFEEFGGLFSRYEVRH